MVLPSATAFFQFREAPVAPAPDGLLVTLGGVRGRVLPAEATFLEQPRHLGRVVGDTELLPDHLGNPSHGPDFPGKPEGRRPLLQQLRELGQLAGLQFARPSRRLAPSKGLGASLPGLGHPPAHRPAGKSQGLGYVGLFPTLLHRFPSPQPGELSSMPLRTQFSRYSWGRLSQGPRQCLPTYSCISK